MNFTEYQTCARRTQNPKLPLWATREHALYLLGAEVGEVLGLHQKVHQGHELKIEDLKLEMGDVLWGLAELCDVYGLSLEDVAVSNIVKLRQRYRNGFSVRESVDRREYRDKNARQRTRYYAKGGGRNGKG